MKKTFSELGRVEAVRLLFEGSRFTPFCEPLHFAAKAGEYVASAGKTFLEGVDFDLVYFPLKHLGYKSVVAVTGELLSVMSHPKTLSVTLGVSAKLDFEQVRELWEGMVTAATEFGYEGLSLELQPSRNGLAISLGANGACRKLTAAHRPAAQSKDIICVSGSLGAAFIGMKLLERGKETFEKGGSAEQDIKKYPMLVGAYLKPELNPAIVGSLEDAGITPSFGYFVNRGLADAVLRLSRDSGLGVKIYADKIPFEGGSFALGKEMNFDPVSAAMNGGDDYKLLFTIPILQLEKFRRDFQTFDIIGHLAQPEVGQVLVSPDGLELGISSQGWK